MYAPFYGLKHKPFSIAPDPRYLYMSERHREALAHLLYGVQGGGGFVLLTGEIGAGKTTVCRCFLEQIPAHCNVGYIFNPKLTVVELLMTICHEFGVDPLLPTRVGGGFTAKNYVDALNAFLLRTHGEGKNNVLIIDEAQNLSSEILEQLRLLTNLETTERKLLQIILIGQPELRGLLARPELEQLAQRVIARYHLEALSEAETARYIAHRLAVAGLTGASPFDAMALRRIHRVTRGVPRRINLLCDRALLGGYASGKARIDRDIIHQATLEVFGPPRRGEKKPPPRRRAFSLGLAIALGALGGAAAMGVVRWSAPAGVRAAPAQAPARSAPAPAPARPVAAAASPAGVASAPPFAFPSASAAAAVTPRLRSIDDLEAQLEHAPREERDALRRIAPAWQLEAGAADACELAAQHDLACFRAHGALALLRQLARPAVLTLRDAHDRPVYVALVGLGKDDATLLVGDTPLHVPLALLTTAWRGDFATLWRIPPGYSGTPVEGARGPQVDIIGLRLAQAQGAAAPPPGQPFDATLKARVYAFQLAQGLPPDGLAGPATLMLLNRASGVSEPWLAGVSPTAAPALPGAASATLAQRK